MKIYFRNKAAKLKFGDLGLTCQKCPFYEITPCPFETFIIVDCADKGFWIGGESLDIFRL